MKKLLISQNTGFCFGVKRAVKMAKKILSQYRELYSVGDIVHNPLVMEDLKKKGLKVINSIDEIKGGNFIVRSHGTGPGIIKSLQNKGVQIFDATCPSVKKIHFLIKELDKEKYFIIIIGDEKHPEVIGLREYGEKTLVYRDKKSLLQLKNLDRIAVIGQTTLSFDDYIKKVCEIAESSFRGKLIIYNTICKVTAERQKEAGEISKKVDGVLVLGGKNSSNTAKLYRTVKRYNRNVFYIEKMEDIKNISLSEFNSLGIVSGASTPEDFIEKVKNIIKKSGYKEVGYNGKRRCWKDA